MTTSVTIKARAWDVKVCVSHKDSSVDEEVVVEANTSHELHVAWPSSITLITEVHPVTSTTGPGSDEDDPVKSPD